MTGGEKQVLKIVRELKEASRETVSRQMRVAPDYVGRLCGVLVKDNYLIKTAKGSYALTHKGRQVLGRVKGRSRGAPLQGMGGTPEETIRGMIGKYAEEILAAVLVEGRARNQREDQRGDRGVLDEIPFIDLTEDTVTKQSFERLGHVHTTRADIHQAVNSLKELKVSKSIATGLFSKKRD